GLRADVGRSAELAPPIPVTPGETASTQARASLGRCVIACDLPVNPNREQRRNDGEYRECLPNPAALIFPERLFRFAPVRKETRDQRVRNQSRREERHERRGSAGASKT